MGGEETVDGEYPWMISIRRRIAMGGSSHHCGGSIIDNHWILTAAHCVDDIELEDFFIRAGDHTMHTDDGELDISIAGFVVNDGWNPTNMDNDIALILLSHPLPCGRDDIRAVCLTETISLASKLGYITGWGQLNEDAGHPPHLHEVQITIFERRACAEDFINPWYHLTENMICAGDNGKDACYGDSGGPLVTDISSSENHQYVQAGIISWGYGCATPNARGIFTRVPNYADFLDIYCQHCDFVSTDEMI